MAAGNVVTTVLFRALLVMAGCYITGSVLGALLQKTVDLHVQRHQEDHPVPVGPGDAEFIEGSG